MNKQQATKVDKISQVLLYVVMFFLLSFLGMGIYFVVRGFMDTVMDTRTIGFIGIGIFFFGMGIVFILQAGMMKDPNGSFIETFFMSNCETEVVTLGASYPKVRELKPILQFEATVSIGAVSKTCVVMVCDDGLWLEKFSDCLIHISYTKMSDVVRDKKRMGVTCECEFEDNLYSGVVSIEVENALRLKAVEDELRKYV